jgi:hypothetical protein
MTHLKAVSKSNPCAICGSDHKCSRDADGVIMCSRFRGKLRGFYVSAIPAVEMKKAAPQARIGPRNDMARARPADGQGPA